MATHRQRVRRRVTLSHQIPLLCHCSKPQIPHGGYSLLNLSAQIARTEPQSPLIPAATANDANQVSLSLWKWSQAYTWVSSSSKTTFPTSSDRILQFTIQVPLSLHPTLTNRPVIKASVLDRLIRLEDVPVQYGGLNRPSDLQNGPPDLGSEFTVKGGRKS